jgi:outer membrane protein with beta-barrel domain
MEASMRRCAALIVILALVPAAASGQSTAAPVSRGDVALSAGWFTADRSPGERCCSGWSSGLFKGITGGLYWTDHLKLEIGVASPGVTDGYGVSRTRLANGQVIESMETHRYDGTKASLSPVYQFGRNSTFEPFVAAGLDLDRERDTVERYDAVSQGPESRVVTSIRARAFAGAGFKAYYSERAFFRGEARFGGGGVHRNQMTWTSGIGIDLGVHDPIASPRLDARSTSRRTPRGAEPVDVWRRFASKLNVGALLDVAPAGADRFTARLVAADADGLLLQPVTRLAEPVVEVRFDRLEGLKLHDGPPAGARVGATFAGVGAGTGVYLMLMWVLIALSGNNL